MTAQFHRRFSGGASAGIRAALGHITRNGMKGRRAVLWQMIKIDDLLPEQQTTA